MADDEQVVYNSIVPVEEPMRSELKEEYPSIDDKEEELPKAELLERFGEWMKNKGIAEATIRSYVSAINVADNYAKEYNLQNLSLISTDVKIDFTISTLRQLLGTLPLDGMSGCIHQLSVP